MIRALALSAALSLAPLMAQADARLTQLFELLELDAYIDITRQDALNDFPALAEGFLGQPPDAIMLRQISGIYDRDRLSDTVRRAMEARLTPDQVSAALIFMDSPTGVKISTLELEARRAMSDPDTEEAALETWPLVREQRPWLAARVEEVKEVSDLVDRNVTGALNSNLKFLQGLAEGSNTDSPQRDMLAEIWAQEPEIRADTDAWLGAYLMLAFQALDEQEMQDYIAFWSTAQGRALNAAMFAAFNEMYDEMSYATARIIALQISSEEL